MIFDFSLGQVPKQSQVLGLNQIPDFVQAAEVGITEVGSGGNHSALGPGLHPARVDGLFGCAPPNSSTPASFTFYPFIQG